MLKQVEYSKDISCPVMQDANYKHKTEEVNVTAKSVLVPAICEKEYKYPLLLEESTVN